MKPGMVVGPSTGNPKRHMDLDMDGRATTTRSPNLNMDPGITGRVNTRDKIRMMNQVTDGRRIQNMDPGMKRRVNTGQVMEKRPTLMSTGQVDMVAKSHPGMEMKAQNTGQVDMGAKPQAGMEMKVQNTGRVDMVTKSHPGMEMKAQNTDRVDMGSKPHPGMEMKVRNTVLVTEMNQVDMGVLKPHLGMDQEKQERVVVMMVMVMVRKILNTGQVMDDKRRTLMNMKKRAKCTGVQQLRGLVMEGPRKRTTGSPAMRNATTMIIAMVAKNMVMMTLALTRRSRKIVAKSALTRIEQSDSVTYAKFMPY